MPIGSSETVLTRHGSLLPVTIAFYNDFWPAVPDSVSDCDLPHRLCFDRAACANADAVVFHLPTMHGVPEIPKRAGQLWVGWTMESDANYPYQANPAFMSHFDLTMSYRRDADIWCPYFDKGLLPGLRATPRVRTAIAPAIYVASNPHDRSGRNEYVRELMGHMRVDSFGRCLRTRVFPIDRGRETKLEAFGRYKFTLSFENSLCTDYVTEKFFDPLLAGSVPVYLGAPNIDDFAPGEDAYIDVRAFSKPRDLGEYLTFLAARPEEYSRYLQWKHAPLRDPFIRLVEWMMKSPFSRLIERCAARRSDRTGA
jgi:alpha-1,3-fucosyltransferase 10